jgi:hypothetical protein
MRAEALSENFLLSPVPSGEPEGRLGVDGADSPPPMAVMGRLLTAFRIPWFAH